MKKKFLILLVFITLFNLCGHSQYVKIDSIPVTDLEKKQQLKVYNLSQFVHETFLFVRQPTQWQGEDWIKIGSVTLATIAFMKFDQTITNATRPNQHFYNSVPIIAGRVYGEWYTIGGLAAVFGVYGLLTKNNKAKKITIELLQAGIYSELFTTLLKTTIGRERPAYTTDPFNFKPFTYLDDNYHSMPSGHTTSAIALSTVMSRHANSTFLKIIAYVPAAFTIVSRIYQDKHWLSDVIPAMAIGYFAGNWVVDLHEGKRHRINVTSVSPPTVSIGLY